MQSLVLINYIEELPTELIIMLLEVMYTISEISPQVLVYVNKFFKRIVSNYAKQNDIRRKMYCFQIADKGHLELLKWARNIGYEWDLYVCSGAAKNGHFEVLKWAHNNGCTWDSRVCHLAAINGHMKILKWARQNGCEWDVNECFSSAAENGHMDIIDWILSCGYLPIHDQHKLLIKN